MTSRATLGYFAITKVPISTNQGFISMVYNDRVLNYYLLNAVQKKKDEIENLASGSTFLEINKTSFKSIKIILPSKSLMQKFDDIADSIYERISQNELETKDLPKLEVSSPKIHFRKNSCSDLNKFRAKWFSSDFFFFFFFTGKTALLRRAGQDRLGKANKVVLAELFVIYLLLVVLN